ncbi:hypothetical protein PAECIP111892_02709 [Paenibacillus auburnensis]|uniref:Uncharacterized protein n=1 Tax=Paenibacillus auburnensis TaxID=2905649 RepID=A0ABN8GEJ7_9BACL|nr:hypothetical protein [Paenibacillus auburnensis]CAH1205529.1 hypothetical protein PAECIP111892_02709 [Paenibacillus auburnensis]
MDVLYLFYYLLKGPEGNFGTGGAVASAFVFGFLPLIAVKIKKSEDNSGRKSKDSLQGHYEQGFKNGDQKIHSQSFTCSMRNRQVDKYI